MHKSCSECGRPLGYDIVRQRASEKARDRLRAINMLVQLGAAEIERREAEIKQLRKLKLKGPADEKEKALRRLMADLHIARHQMPQDYQEAGQWNGDDKQGD